jgi:3-dehydroquinate dehydratase-2
MKILVIHGPNLNLLGTREPEIYGRKTLKEIDSLIRAHARRRSATATTFQSNHEGDIIDRIQKAVGKGSFDALIINPGAFTHTSLAIRDAIQSVGIRAIEVHLSNIYAREEFRRQSVIAPVCAGQITGFGYRSYLLAIDALTKG